MSARDEVLVMAQDLVLDRLSQCTEKQQATFKKAFPKGTLTLEQCYTAIDLCNRTIAANDKPAGYEYCSICDDRHYGGNSFHAPDTTAKGKS